jgi:hypothetical protein
VDIPTEALLLRTLQPYPAHLAYHLSAKSNNGPDWLGLLRTFPGSNIIHERDFVPNLRLHLFLPTISTIPDETVHCACKPADALPYKDIHYHCFSCQAGRREDYDIHPSIGAHGINCRRHQHIAQALQKFLRHCYEPINTQVHYEWSLPNNAAGVHQRMDVVVDSGGGSMILFDVVVTSPCSNSNLINYHSATVPLASSTACVARKRSTFLRVYPEGSQHHDLNNHLVPIALECTGAFAPATLTSLNHLVQQARTRGEGFGDEAAKALKAFFRTVAVILARDRAASLGHFQSRVTRHQAQAIAPTLPQDQAQDLDDIPLPVPNTFPHQQQSQLNRIRDPSPTNAEVQVELRVTENLLNRYNRHPNPLRRASQSSRPPTIQSSSIPRPQPIHRSTAEDMDQPDYAISFTNPSPD